MKNSNFIAESVFTINLKYSRLQNQTKELFFKCLDEGQDVDYFKEKIEQLWGNLNHDFIEEQIAEYEEIIHEYNMEGFIEPRNVESSNTRWFGLIPLSVAIYQEQKFVKYKEREYARSISSKAYEVDKEEYLKIKVSKYTNQIVPYFSRETGELIRYVQLSTYEAMIHNTNLTRSGWNTTLNDADIVGVGYFYIPYHPFSCEHCLEHQNRVMTKQEVIDLIGFAEEAEGDILHPNCKCVLTFYGSGTQFNKPLYTDAELQEQYDIRQKVNSLTLKKEEIATDMKIQERLGNEDEVDKLNQQRNKINSQIRDLKEQLPTEELQKQVVAIYR